MRTVRKLLWIAAVVTIVVIVVVSLQDGFSLATIRVKAKPPNYLPAQRELEARLMYVRCLGLEAGMELKCEVLNAKVVDLHCEDGELDIQPLDKLVYTLRKLSYPFDNYLSPNEWRVLLALSGRSETHAINHDEYDRLIHLLMKSFP